MSKLPAASAAVVLLIALGAAGCKKAEAPAGASGEGAAPAAAAAPAATADGGPDTKYQCSPGGVVPVSYKTGSVSLKHNDQMVELKVDPANPDRYTGAGIEWWVNGRGQGATANLYTQTPEGTAGELIRGCVENPKA